jgi:hypothetical protein
MCGDGPGGGDGPGAPTGPGIGPGPGGGSGGNVGQGDPGGGGGATGRGDLGQQGAVGAPGTPSGPGGGTTSSGGNVQGDFEGINADLGVNLSPDIPAPGTETASGMSPGELGNIMAGSEGAFGITPTQGLQMGLLTGNLPLALMGMMLGHAVPGGNVSDYGGGDPDAGGGPWAGDPGFMERGEEGGGLLRGDSGLTFGGGATSPAIKEMRDAPEDPFSLGLSSDPGSWMYKSRLLQKDDDALGEDFLRGDFDKFTRSLF